MQTWWLQVAAGLAACLAACSKPNPVVCCSSPADCYAIGATDQTRACNDGFVCIDHECANAPPVDAAPPGPACTVDTDCPSSAPHCTPQDVCVQCETSSQCAGSTPVCDTTTNSCRGCSADADCDSDVCDLDHGTCTTSTTVIYASPTGVTTGTCEQATPCSLSHALDVVGGARTIVRMSPGSYNGNPTITGKQVTIDGTGSTLNAAGGGRAIEILDGASVHIIGLNVVSPVVENGIACEPASASPPFPTLTLTGVSVDTGGSAVIANPCNVTIERSTLRIRSTAAQTILASAGTPMTISRSSIRGGDGIWSLGGTSVVRIENSVMLDQIGSDGALVGAGLGSSGFGSISATFTTFFNSQIKCTTGLPRCAGGQASGACVDNSIIVGTTGDSVTGDACRVSYTIVTPQSSALTGGSNKVGVDPLLTDPQNNDFTLRVGSPAIDAADPTAVVPAVDYVGTQRPQGTRADMGAFEYKP